MESVTSEPVCAAEALDLLNCVAADSSPSFDRGNCLRLLDALRICVIEKKVKKFSLAGQGEAAGTPQVLGRNPESSS